jgi:hypothetical protein
MSVSPTSWDLSNRETRSWLIIVIVLVIVWPSVGTVAATYTDAVALVSLLTTVAGTANKSSTRRN